jgi:hypothetical protein
MGTSACPILQNPPERINFDIHLSSCALARVTKGISVQRVGEMELRPMTCSPGEVHFKYLMMRWGKETMKMALLIRHEKLSNHIVHLVPHKKPHSPAGFRQNPIALPTARTLNISQKSPNKHTIS